MYKVKSVALLAGLALLFAFLNLALFGWISAALVLGFAVLLNLATVDRARDLILWIHRARPIGRREAPQLHGIAEELARRAQVEVPRLMTYRSQMANAFAIGARKGRAVVAVSSALLNILDRREMRGVLAHEFAHLKNRDSILSLTSGIFVQVITVLSRGFSLLLLLTLIAGGAALEGTALVQLLPLLALVAAAPTGAAMLQAGLMRTRERLADRDAARMTGDPRGLASALFKLQEYSRYLTGWLRRFRFIYTSEAERGPRLMRSHPPTEERVRRLLEIEEARPAKIPVVHLPSGFAGYRAA